MQIRVSQMRLVCTLLAAAVVTVLTPSSLTAQSAWDKLKQETKQAIQQPQQQKTSQQQSTPSAKPVSQPVGASAASGPDSSCCTAAAMKTMAAQAGSVDIVGIKLGMTPQQATAAIKAHNPALTVYTINMRLTHPGAKNFIEVPHYIVATNNPPGVGQRKTVGLEAIVLEFTTPPNSPLLTMASRYTNFAPTLAGNLASELDKKYGPEYPRQVSRSWVYDSSGKPVTTSSRAIDACAATMYGPLGRQTTDAASSGGLPQGNTSGNFDVDTYKYLESTSTAPQINCIPYTVVWTSLPTDVAPNTQLTQISVMISSGGLNYASLRSTGDWLQAEADALAKAAHDAAAQSKGTTF